MPVTILAGSVVRVWAPLEAVLSRHEGMLSKSDRTMRVVRVDFGDGEILIGVRYPAHLLPEVVAALTAAQLLMPPPQALAKGIGEDALQASAMGAVGAVAVEPPTPVDKKSLAKALRFGLPSGALGPVLYLGDLKRDHSKDWWDSGDCRV